MYERNNQPEDENRSAIGRLVPFDRTVPTLREPGDPLAGFPGGVPDRPGDIALDLLEYWRIIFKRKWLVLSILAACLALGAVKTLMQTPLYTATVRIQIDRSAVKVVEGGNVTPTEGMGSEFLRTQYELLQSRTMAERVASALNLGNDADFHKSRGISILHTINALFWPTSSSDDDPPDAAKLERVATETVLKNRVVRPVSGSRIVDITYSDPVPSRARRIANAYANAFVAANLDKRFQANAYAKTFLEDQIKQLKLRMERSEKTLVNFAEQEQIVGVSESTSIAEINLSGANKALGNLVTDRIENE